MIATNEMTRKITPDNALKLLFPSSKESEILFTEKSIINTKLKQTGFKF